jgi:hypothetical protein
MNPAAFPPPQQPRAVLAAVKTAGVPPSGEAGGYGEGAPLRLPREGAALRPLPITATLRATWLHQSLGHDQKPHAIEQRN